MTFEDKKDKPSEQLDPSIKESILKHAANGRLSCAIAFEMAKKLEITVQEVGNYADCLDIKLVKCQLGLFGYQPEKKITKPIQPVTQELKNAINDELVNGRLACENAWDIASRLKTGKMKVSSACEVFEIKITKCQLGAF